MFTNVSASALTAVLQVPLGYISSDPFAWTLCQKLIRETVDVAAALGMDFDYDQKVAEVRAVCDNSPNGLTSIYTDLKKGRRSEVDTISGSIVRAGEKAGVPTPNHAFMVTLIHAMEDKAAGR
jgi:2-dehydropantoate 2-reductase